MGRSAPVGVVLAGGLAVRLGGGGKAHLPLAGRMMIDWPLAALGAELQRVAVVAKHATPLPPLPAGVETWREPDEPRHPLAGILEALRRAAGGAVVVCAVDLPLVDAATIRALSQAPAAGAPAVVAGGTDAAGIQPLLGRYEPAALALLGAAAPDARLRDSVAALHPRVLAVADETLLNVNDEADLRRAEAALARRLSDQPNVKA